MTVRADKAYRHHFHVALKINLSRAASVLYMRTRQTRKEKKTQITSDNVGGQSLKTCTETQKLDVK